MGFLLVLEGSEAAELKLQLMSGVRPGTDFWGQTRTFLSWTHSSTQSLQKPAANKDLALLEMGQRPDVGLIPGRPLQLPGVPLRTKASSSSDTLRIKLFSR